MVRQPRAKSTYKYNVRERKIAQKIYYLIERKKAAERRYRYLDIQIVFLKNELKGKYGPNIVPKNAKKEEKNLQGMRESISRAHL
jgi:hypothetical protein